MPSKDTFPLRANRARMRREFNAQAKIGKYGKTGLDRVAFTPVYGEVRDLAEGWMKAAGLKTRVDAVGNLYGRKEGRVRGLPAVVAGLPPRFPKSGRALRRSRGRSLPLWKRSAASRRRVSPTITPSRLWPSSGRNPHAG